MKIDLKIYTIYHNNELYDKYNLYESDIVKPINIKNIISDKNDPLIKYNKQLSEFATMVYLWKNNIKSDYIGFQHYRRSFFNYDIDKLKEGYTLVLHKWPVYNYFSDREEPNLNYRLNVTDTYLYHTIRFKEYIYINYNKYYYHRLHNILYDNDFDKYKSVYGREMYITNWNTFSKIIKCIYGYLQFVYGENLENILEFDNIYRGDQKYVFENIDKKISFGKDIFRRYHRYLACYIESLISLCIKLFSENIDVCDKNRFAIQLNYTGNENITKWVNKQYVTGVSEIFINNINNKKIYFNNYRYQDVRELNDDILYNFIIEIDNEKCLSKYDIIKLNNYFSSMSKNNIKEIRINDYIIIKNKI